jgi:carbon-monoxide dehydrogenase large subunit
MPDTQTPTPSGFGIGAALPRVEDARLLRGLGRYTDDLRAEGMVHAHFLRSPHAMARIASLDAAPARAMPGVVAVLTGADWVGDGLGRLGCTVPRTRPGGAPMPIPPHVPMAPEIARHVGDPVAVVIAETRSQAKDAAEEILVEWEPLAAVTDAAAALAPGAPAVWPGLCDDNLAFLFELGDRAAVEAAMGRAAHVVTLELRISRVTTNPMEPRAALGEWDEAEARFTLRSGVQNPHGVRDELASRILGVPGAALRVVSPDMGGAFGLRGQPTPEQAVVLWAARKLGRPVKWNAERSEAIASDAHARDNHTRASLAVDAEGRFLALRVETIANLGAYLALLGPHSPTNNLGGLAGVYTTPAIFASVRGAFTNTQSTAPYRGAGRPEASYVIERMVDLAAAKLGMDRAEIRRRNLIPRAAMPYRTGLVFTYDSGEFARSMDIAMQAADVAGFPSRRAASEARGRRRGLGIANAIEIAAGPPRTPMDEGAEVRFAPDGSATILLGTHNHGQGHETAFRQLAHSMLGLPFERVRIVSGDTDQVHHGRGTFGSRSIVAGGTALRMAADRVIAKGRKIAAHLLEAAEADIAFEAGRFRVAGTDRTLGWAEVARAVHTPGRMGPGFEGGLGAQAQQPPADATFPNGCHVCEVEVDPETGEAQVVRYVVADDVGVVVNPLLLKGQIQGGVAQGLGQALMENVVFDAESGQLLSASFMDYAMPRASDLPCVEVLGNHDPTPSNPLGAKGAGEAGTVGSLPAVMSAVCDAIGVAHLDMPATPPRIWAALRAAGR